MKTNKNEELLKIVVEVTENNKELIDVVFDLVVKIKDLPNGTTTSIAKLIDYKPEVSLVNPLTQGKVSSFVNKVCKTIEIQLEQKKDSFGGLAYFNEFTKC